MTLVMALLASSLMAATTTSGMCRPIPTLTLSFDDPVQEVSATDIQGKAKFCGWARVDGLVVERLVIRLSVRVDAGWEAEVTPNTMIITDYHKHGFNVTVRVPPDTHNGTVGVAVEGNGRSSDGYNTVIYHGTALGLVTIQPFEEILFETGRPCQEPDGSGTARFNFYVVNRGNSNLSFRLEVSSGVASPEHAWTAKLSSSSGNLPQGGRRGYVAEVRLPKNGFGLQSGMTVVNISATTQSSLDYEPVVRASMSLVVLSKSSLPPLVASLSVILLACLAVAEFALVRSRGLGRGALRFRAAAGKGAIHPGKAPGPDRKKG